MTITPTRCEKGGNICEVRSDLDFDEVCEKMNSFNFFGGSFLQAIHPPLICPFRKVKPATSFK
jgi:hypothetical protein